MSRPGGMLPERSPPSSAPQPGQQRIISPRPVRTATSSRVSPPPPPVPRRLRPAAPPFLPSFLHDDPFSAMRRPVSPRRPQMVAGRLLPPHSKRGPMVRPAPALRKIQQPGFLAEARLPLAPHPASLRIFDLPQDALTGGGGGPDSWPVSLRLAAGELIYDFAWYPAFDALEPQTCCFLSTCRVRPRLTPLQLTGPPRRPSPPSRLPACPSAGLDSRHPKKGALH